MLQWAVSATLQHWLMASCIDLSLSCGCFCIVHAIGGYTKQHVSMLLSTVQMAPTGQALGRHRLHFSNYLLLQDL